MKSSKRELNVELFRIVLMLGICLVHTVFIGAHHGIFGMSEWLNGLVGGAVDAFVFISGWYGIKFKTKKILAFYALALTCAVECRVVSVICGNIPGGG